MTDQRAVTCNDTQRVFVIPSGSSGFSCFGYDNCFRDSKALAEKLGRPDMAPKESEIGTLAQYQGYRALIAEIKPGVDLGTWFTPGTPKEVERILESARQSRQRLRIEYGNKETGALWGERPQIGRIGRSMGPMKVPLLIANSRSTGGGAILTDCIVRISESVGRHVLYEHPGLKAAPEQEVAPAPGL